MDFQIGNNNIVVSGGNEGDVRVYDLGDGARGTVAVYKHHDKKVLSLKSHPHRPHLVYTASADGTVRRFDLREKQTIENIDARRRDFVVPQILGGGRYGRGHSSVEAQSSIILDYKTNPIPEALKDAQTILYAIDIHPRKESEFLIASSLGDVRIFDDRKLDPKSKNDPVRIHTPNANKGILDGTTKREILDVTGAQFSPDGAKICATVLADAVYVIDDSEVFFCFWKLNLKLSLEFI